MTPAPDSRLSVLVDAPVREDGEFVLYWMIAERRPTHSFGLQHAVHHACAWGVPLLVLEPLDCTYRWASDRFHAFVIAGMRDNRDHFAATPVHYHPYVEPEPGHRFMAPPAPTCSTGTGTHSSVTAASSK